jgi:hypothetical protein
VYMLASNCAHSLTTVPWLPTEIAFSGIKLALSVIIHSYIYSRRLQDMNLSPGVDLIHGNIRDE